MKREYGLFERERGSGKPFAQVKPDIHGPKDWLCRIAQNWLLASCIGSETHLERELRPIPLTQEQKAAAVERARAKATKAMLDLGDLTILDDF